MVGLKKVLLDQSKKHQRNKEHPSSDRPKVCPNGKMTLAGGVAPSRQDLGWELLYRGDALCKGIKYTGFKIMATCSQVIVINASALILGLPVVEKFHLSFS